MKLIARRTDGFGAQLQFYVFSLLNAKDTGEKVYLPSNLTFEHNYVGDPKFNTNLVDYMNLHKYYGCPSDVNEADLPVFTVDYSHVEPHLDRLLQSSFFQELKQQFLENKINTYDPSFTNVAVHIRRLNPHDSRIWGSDTPDDFYLRVIDTIRKEHPVGAKPLRFHLFSQGYSEHFYRYYAEDTVLRLNESIQDTMNGFLFPDILVTSSSSFSYIGAFFTNAKVYHQKFWHKSPSFWRIFEV